MTYLYRLPDDCTKEDYREAIARGLQPVFIGEATIDSLIKSSYVISHINIAGLL